MNLGELEFKPEDFELCKGELTEERMIQRAAQLANNFLREKLAKAPEVQSNWSVGKYHWCEINRVRDTHRARLVCIEEVGE
jgi:hypothetical protein